MSHECENCGQACYCDLDDCPLPAPDDCRHECQEQPDEFDEWNSDPTNPGDIAP